ncbi:hypothetical protein [Limnohabitans sp.]|uniref:hypothetical protein n=1 Tax=Limnohabitans sp. TaxID=1907725 RepID=UPI00286FA813|nr:hypothetical protein [Limnohabitans sp.]
MPTHTCKALVLKCAEACPPGTAMRWHTAITFPGKPQTSLQTAFTPHAENGLPMMYVYVRFSEPTDLSPDDCAALEKAWYALTGHAAQISRLQEVMHLETQHPQETLGAHYVVETDPEQGWEEEIFKWYDEEHLPGLSRVPGCMVARRYLNLDHGPRSFACYDLLNPEVVTTAPWLAVRGTAWSDICRPHFTNTLRTMFNQKES